MEKKLYSWQEECLKKWFASGGRGMVQAATGSGKTLLALAAAARLEGDKAEGLRIKIVVPTAALMRQWSRAIRELPSEPGGRKDIGLRGGGQKASPNHKYMIYVINSARYELARQILDELKRGENVLLIADECHRYESGQNRLIFEFMPYIETCDGHFFSMGLSATLPSGEGGRYLASVLGPRVYSYGILKASAMHTVCRYDIYHISLTLRREERDEYEELTDRMTVLHGKLLKAVPFLGSLGQKEFFEMLRTLSGGKNRRTAELASRYMSLAYKRKSLVCLAWGRIECTCELVKRLSAEEKIIIFGERISQAEELYLLLNEAYPGKAGRYHSEMGQQANKNTLERFRSGDIRILITCKALDEGVDVPDASTGIILSSTSTRRQRIQRLGRIIRRQKGKSGASLYYLHIAETSEDSCYLPGGGENRLLELEYLPEKREFYNASYDAAARSLMEEQLSLDGDRAKAEEIGRCLRLGSVRSDWLREPGELEERIREAQHLRDRNYWVCMKKLRKYSEENEPKASF